MPDPTVKLVFAGNAKGAEAAIAQLERKFEAMENKLKHTGDSAKRSFDKSVVTGMENAMMGLATRTLGVGAAIGFAKSQLDGMAAKAKETADQISALWERQQPEELKLKMAAELTPQQMQTMMPNLKSALMKTPALTLPEMTAMAGEIAGAGFVDEDVKSGKAAAAMLRVRAGMGTFGKDTEPVKESAKAISSLLASQGATMDAAGIERVGMKTAALAAKTNMAFSDLKQLSQAAGALSQIGVDESKMMAAFSVTMESGGAMVGSTGLKNIGLRLATAAGDKERTEQLEKIGLKPEDVAIAKGGVTLPEAGEKLRTALAGKTEVEKNTFFAKFFGGDAVASAATLFSDAGFAKFKERTGIAENAENEMKKRLETFELSRFAVGRRHLLGKEFALYDQAVKNQTSAEFEAMEAEKFATERAKRTTAWGRGGLDWAESVLNKANEINKGLGVAPGDAGVRAWIGLGGAADKPTTDADWAAIARKQLQALEKQNALMEENNRLLNQQQNNRPLAVQGQREPAP